MSDAHSAYSAYRAHSAHRAQDALDFWEAQTRKQQPGLVRKLLWMTTALAFGAYTALACYPATWWWGLALAVLLVALAVVAAADWRGRTRPALRQDPFAKTGNSRRILVAIIALFWPNLAGLARNLLDPVPAWLAVALGLGAAVHAFWALTSLQASDE